MKLLLKDLDGKIRCIADSAVGRTSQPWFKPDVGSNWQWRVALACKVSRLGKNVSDKFIDRYIDSMTLLWVAEADDFSALDYIDGAVVCGRWIDIDGQEIDSALADCVVEVSRYATIKNGDIVAVMMPGESRIIERDSNISLSLMGDEVINFNIK